MKDIFSLPIAPSFSSELPADPLTTNVSRQVESSCFSFVKPISPARPELIHYSASLLKEWNVGIENKKEFTEVMSGNKSFLGFRPYAMCYGGHQFGQWAGQLGDGRAINIAELEVNNSLLKFQLKGAGPTPYSRRADGLAVLRSSIREYLCSEAMHNLRVPTTRALSLIKTGDMVPRDMLYNGNVRAEPGAIVCRTAPSFIRFGNFEIFASRQDKKNLTNLVDYTIKHHFKELGSPSKTTYLSFFEEVVNRTLSLVIHWQRVGFVHGVMNTDNLSILGLTIDFGPYGWLEDYNPGWTPNTTDAQHRRYRFGNQPNVALWNLTQLANALYQLIDEAEPLENILTGFKVKYAHQSHSMMCNKIGLYSFDKVSDGLIYTLEENLRVSEMDMTIFFREISSFESFKWQDFKLILKQCSYMEESELISHFPKWKDWFKEYKKLVLTENIEKKSRLDKMKLTNPKYVLRNYMAQLAIEKAEIGDYSLVDELYTLLQNPYDEQPEFKKWYAKRPEWAKQKVGCSMLSCSS